MKRSHNVPAFTIVEIVIAVIIIGILATTLIPVLIKKVEGAKVTSAKRDLEEIANAEDRVAIDTGYYVRLFALDAGTTGTSVDFGDLPGFSSMDTIFINPDPRDQTLTTAQGLLDKLAYVTPESPYKWDGPYYNIHRDETLEQNDSVSTPKHLHGIPNDPWGNDYLLFTREGLVKEPDGEMVTIATDFSGSPATQVFDRPTVLSLGPNGVPGPDAGGQPAFGKGDDIARAFGY